MTATDNLFVTMEGFSAAEEFLDFFGIRYEPAVVNVNRLHILKRFRQYLQIEEISVENEELATQAMRTLLERAYQDFVRSNAVTEKVFKVFQHAQGQTDVDAENLVKTLPSRRTRLG